jgi:hypothetical protein
MLSGAQDETFVPLRGTLTMYLGDPPERHHIPVGGLVHVEAGTAAQIVNETDESSSCPSAVHRRSAPARRCSTAPSSATAAG